MIQEILDLGIHRIELGHGVKVSLLPGIVEMKEKGVVEITSLHNFCPLPVEVLKASPNCYEFSSHRSSDRERAIRLTKQTIDTAVRLGATRVVLHLGTIRTMKITTRDLITMVENGLIYSRKYTQLKLAMVREREKVSAFYLKRVEECLKPILDHAQANNILLGIECRDRYEEIPSEREIPELLTRLGATTGYWHDFGHQQIKHNLGLTDHFQWLKKIGPQTIGSHLHDVEWPNDDHRPPFSGEIDFKKLVSYLPQNILFVLEMNPRRSKADIMTAIEQWRGLFPE